MRILLAVLLSTVASCPVDRPASYPPGQYHRTSGAVPGESGPDRVETDKPTKRSPADASVSPEDPSPPDLDDVEPESP